jgi:nucleotidyltransferase/DNA polymerase involved in DNA repair
MLSASRPVPTFTRKALNSCLPKFGKIGPYFYSIARGMDNRPARADRIRKSIGAENTFQQDLLSEAECREATKCRFRRSRPGVPI